MRELAVARECGLKVKRTVLVPDECRLGPGELLCFQHGRLVELKERHLKLEQSSERNRTEFRVKRVPNCMALMATAFGRRTF